MPFSPTTASAPALLPVNSSPECRGQQEGVAGHQPLERVWGVGQQNPGQKEATRANHGPSRPVGRAKPEALGVANLGNCKGAHAKEEGKLLIMPHLGNGEENHHTGCN